MIEDGIQTGELENTELFMFTNNATAKGAYFKGSSSSKLFFHLVLRLHVIKMTGALHLHITHMAGLHMVAQGTDCLSHGDLTEGIMSGVPMSSFVPLHLSAIECQPMLLPWLQSWVPSSDIQPLPLDQWYE